MRERATGGNALDKPGKTPAAADYPDAKLLRRERKVKDRAEKEKIRGGTKHRKHVRSAVSPGNISDLADRIICGDSERVLKEFPPACVDIIVTSPPYNFGLDYGPDGHRDAVFWSDYFEKLNRIWTECVRVLKHGGLLFVQGRPGYPRQVLDGLLGVPFRPGQRAAFARAQRRPRFLLGDLPQTVKVDDADLGSLRREQPREQAN